MTDKRLVHDILSETDGNGSQRRPVAFIQHGNKEDGFTYESICPFCGDTLSYIPEKNTKVIGGLYRVLLYSQKLHWDTCKQNSAINPPRSFAVEISTKPLNTEKPFTIQ